MGAVEESGESTMVLNGRASADPENIGGPTQVEQTRPTSSVARHFSTVRGAASLVYRAMESAPLPLVVATLIGVVAGLRTMTAPAAVSWAASLGWLNLQGTPLAFLGYAWTPWILTLLAAMELVADQLPSTPSRTVPPQFGARLISGALSGAAIGAAAGSLVAGGIAGVAGAVIGTLGGRMFRARLGAAFRRDPPAAFLEDAIAVGGAVLLMMVAA